MTYTLTTDNLLNPNKHHHHIRDTTTTHQASECSLVRKSPCSTCKKTYDNRH